MLTAAKVSPRVDGVRLDEFTRDEWWDIARIFRPDWTREQFDAEWDESQARYAARRRELELS